MIPEIDLIGYFANDFGLAKFAAEFRTAMRNSSIPHQVHTVKHSKKTHSNTTEDENRPRNQVQINFLNPDGYAAYLKDSQTGESSSYRIGVWFWEVDQLPAWHLPHLDLVDEIWVPTAHIREVYTPFTKKPVVEFPFPVAPGTFVPSAPRLPGPYRFYCAFDFASVVKRKNPLGAVDAFLKAFPLPGQAELWIKSVNADHDPAGLKELRSAILNAPHINHVDGDLPRNLLNACLNQADCLLSLHRAEGYGFHLIEAMLAEKPVIATGWSGNMTYMNEANSFPLPYHLAQVGSGGFPYPEHAVWAEPDIEEAARLIHFAATNSADANAKGKFAAQDLISRFTHNRFETWLREQLVRISRKIQSEGLPLHRPALVADQILGEPNQSPESKHRAGFPKRALRFLLRKAKAAGKALEARLQD